MTTQYIKKTSLATFYYKDIEGIIKHREDGPAVEWADGNKEWWIDGKRHREDGPAVVSPNGYEAWCKNGRLLAEVISVQKKQIRDLVKVRLTKPDRCETLYIHRRDLDKLIEDNLS